MMVRLSGGRDARIEPQFLVFTNRDRNYPIRCVPDNFDGVSYRTGTKGWMDTRVMTECLKEKKLMRDLPNNFRRIFVHGQLQRAERDGCSFL